jgi:ferredoxin
VAFGECAKGIVDNGVAMKKTIDKVDINPFLTSLLRDHTIFAPAKVANYVSYREIATPDEIVWDCLVTREPPKDVFFPQTEVLFNYTRTPDGLALQSNEAVDKERILWGMRPCDAQAMLVQDKVFDTSEDRDVYYTNKRAKTTVVGIGCNQPLSTCFCTAVGGAPFKKDGFDVFLTDIGDAYLAEALTDKGEQLLQTPFLRAATAAADEQAKGVEKAARAQLPQPMDVKTIQKHLDELVASPFWDEVQASCIGCGVCTLLCPVCSCFDIVDEGTAACGQRVRNWDTCQSCVYTLEASGHNPRPAGRERVRQRLMHKFDYYLVNQGVLGCVGCGRCVQLCPVNLDIRRIVDQIGAAQ